MAKRPVAEPAGKSVEFGIRFEDEQIVYYGLDVLNRHLRKGMSVVRIEEGDPIVAEVTAEDGTVDYALAGVGFRAELVTKPGSEPDGAAR